MNARDRKLLDDVTANAEELADLDRRATAAKARRVKLFVRCRTAKIDTADVADAARVEPVTVRQLLRRARIESE